MKRSTSIIAWAAFALLFAAFVASPAWAHQNCTPGFWKNHTATWPSPFTPNTTLKQVFEVEGWTFPTEIDPALTNATLLEALNFQGGTGVNGAFQILMRAATASLLNAQKFGAPPFEWDVLAVIADVKTAMPFGQPPSRNDMLVWAALFDYFNNAPDGSCPLGGAATV